MNDVQQWEQTCPLCGGPNRCAMAAQEPPERCWCVDATISAGTLAAIPADSVGRRCVCPNCAAGKGGAADAG